MVIILHPHYDDKQPMKGKLSSRLLSADWIRRLISFIPTTCSGPQREISKQKWPTVISLLLMKAQSRKGKGKRIQMIAIHNWITFRERTSVDKWTNKFSWNAIWKNVYSGPKMHVIRCTLNFDRCSCKCNRTRAICNWTLGFAFLLVPFFRLDLGFRFACSRRRV